MGRRGWWWWALGGAATALAAVGLHGARQREEERAAAVERGLGAIGMRGFFHGSEVADLPPPARRWLLRAIAPGTPLATVARLETTGRIRLTPAHPWQPFRAHEVVAPPRGFVWRATVGRGPLALSGFDAYADGRVQVAWWSARLLPALRGHGPGLARSAAGRAAYAAIWVPSALLPSAGARWEPVDRDTADVTLVVGGDVQKLRVTVDSEGRLVRAHVMRCRGVTTEPRIEPFGFDRVLEEGTFGGYRVPTRVIAGWSLGTRDAYLFHDLRVERIAYG